jgi:hypothetical protein
MYMERRFGLARRARGVNHHAGRFAVERGRVVVAVVQQVAVAHFQRGVEAHIALGAIHDEHALHLRQVAQGFEGSLAHGHDFAAAGEPVGDEEPARLGVLHARLDRLRAEAREQRQRNRADAPNRQQRNRRFGDKRQEQPDAVAGLHALLEQPACERVHLAQQLGVGVAAYCALLALPHERERVAAPCPHMALQRVVSPVQPPADEPLRERLARREVYRLRVGQYASGSRCRRKTPARTSRGRRVLFCRNAS